MSLKPPARPWLPRAGLGTSVAIALLAGAVLLGGPRLLNLPVVKSRVEHKFSQLAGGQIAYERLQVRLLPAPHIEIGGVVLELPGWGEARIEQAQVGLRLLALLHGQLEFTSIAVYRPILRIDLRSAAPPRGKTQRESVTNPVSAYRSAMKPLVQAMHKTAPGALLEVSDADATLQGVLEPELRIRGLSLRMLTDSNGFNLEASAASNLWDRLNLAGRVEFADMSANFGLDIDGLDANAWLDDWFAGGWLRMDVPRADVRLRAITDARTELRCGLGIEIASLRIAHATHGLPVSRSRLKATAALRTQGIEVTLNELRMGSLIPEARGTLRMNTEGEEPRLEVELPRLDVGAVREFVIALMGAENPAARRYVTRALGGAITHLTMRSQGKSWNALVRLDHLQGNAGLEHASFLLPFVEQQVQELNGRIALDHGAFELAGANAKVGPSRVSDASLRYSIRSGAISARSRFELDTTQALAIARSALPQGRASALDDIEASAGRLQGLANFSSRGVGWYVGVNVERSDALVRARSLPWPVSLRAAQASITPSRVNVSGMQLVAGSSKFYDLSLSVALAPEPRFTDGSGRATLALEEIYPWMRSHAERAQGLGSIESVSGGVQIILTSLSGALDQPAALAFDATIRPEQLRVGMKGWPAALTLDGGAVYANAAAVRFDRVSAAMLDARGSISGEVAGYRGAGTRVKATLAVAVVGEKCAHWIWQRTGAPPQFEPKAPLRIAVERFSFSPDQVLDTLGSVTFESGPTATVDLRWAPDALDIRRLVIRDQTSNATFSLHRLQGGLLEAEFSGSIFGRSVNAMFKHVLQYRGQASGQLRVTLDLEHPGPFTAQGAITAQDLELDELLAPETGAPLRVDRLDLRADASSVQIRDAAVRWAQQVATIRGQIARENQSVVVDIELDSPGIQGNALLQRGEQAPPLPRRAAFFSWMRTMAVRGRIRLRSDFVEFDHVRLAPVAATVTLKKEWAELRLQDTRLCELSTSMTAQITPAGQTVSAQILADRQQIENVAQCLTGKDVLLTGEFDARADLTTSGEVDELLANLAGTVHVQSRNGVVRKFALIGNILAATDIFSALAHGLPDLNAEGFAYRTLKLDGNFNKGRFFVDNLVFDSSAVGLGAEGSIGLAHGDTDLDVLVTPFSGLRNWLRQLPIIGPVLGGTLIGIPVAVKGDIRDPNVVPLDPAAVTSELAARVRRGLNLPEIVVRRLRSSAAPVAPRQ